MPPGSPPSFMDRVREAPTWVKVAVPAAVVILAVAAVTSGGDEQPSPSSVANESSEDSASSAAAAEGSQEPSPPGPTITGMGARVEDWESAHTPDPEFEPGTAYDPDPSLAPPGGDPTFSSRYYAVISEDGRITSYEMRFAPGTTIAQARASTRMEFPSDAKVDWFRTVGASDIAGPCAQTDPKRDPDQGA